MQRSLIIIGIGIAIALIGIAVFSSNQPEEIQVVDKPENNEEIDIQSFEDVLEEKTISDRLDEIERKAAENEFTPKAREWQTSGPFQIDRSEYYIGEKIFLIIDDLKEHEKGEIAFLRPLNDTHYSVFQTIPFDGMNKPAFNYYTEPRLSVQLGICSVEDVIGEWTVVFRGTNYSNLKFTVIDQILPGEEDSFEIPVC